MIRVFIIDDSVLIRYALTQLLNQEGDIVVVGDAPSSDELESQIKKAKPDLLIFDIPLPRESGISRLKELSRLKLSSIVFTKSDKVIAQDLIQLLEYGAVGFVTKPESDEDINKVKDQIVYEIRSNGTKKTVVVDETDRHRFLSPPQIVVIGSSTGGPEALMEVIPKLPSNFGAGIVIVQHMPEDFTRRFAERMNSKSQLVVKEAEMGDMVKSGLVLLAPGDYHLLLEEVVIGDFRHARVKLTKDPPQWKLRPTVDKMMLSVAPIYKNNCIGVILTGMGEDGVVGMREIKHNGGRTLVQDKRTSVVFGMGQEVIKNNLADEVF